MMLTMKSSRDPPLEIAWGGSKRRCRHRRGRFAHADGDYSRRGKPPTRVASGDDEGRAAGRRERSDATGELRLQVDPGSNRTTRWQNDGRPIELRNNASRQMLEHLALETVVIGRVSRATGNIGCVTGVLMSCRRWRRMRVPSVVLRGMVGRRQVHPDPRQETQRRPGQREQRIGCDPRAPATAAQRVASWRALQTMRWRHRIEENAHGDAVDQRQEYHYAGSAGLRGLIRARAGIRRCRYGRITRWK